MFALRTLVNRAIEHVAAVAPDRASEITILLDPTAGESLGSRQAVAAEAAGVTTDYYRRTQYQEAAALLGRALFQVGNLEEPAAEPTEILKMSMDILIDSMLGLSAIDPVAEPAAYHELLAGLVGRRQADEMQAEAPRLLRVAFSQATPNATRYRPAEDAWSAIEALGHLCDSELNALFRYHQIVASDAPTLIGYEQTDWVVASCYQMADAETLLDRFAFLRTWSLALWASMSDQAKARAGRHDERGDESITQLFTMQAGHDRLHLKQIKSALAAARSTSGGE